MIFEHFSQIILLNFGVVWWELYLISHNIIYNNIIFLQLFHIRVHRQAAAAVVLHPTDQRLPRHRSLILPIPYLFHQVLFPMKAL